MITKTTAYPKEMTLDRSDYKATIRYLDAGDAEELLEFFRRVPAEDRLYLKKDVTSPEVIDAWVTRIDFNWVIPLVALVEGETVADATLHRSRTGTHRHIGEIRVVVDLRYRNIGLGTLMVRELVDLAYDNALDTVVFELVEGKEDAAIKVATLPRFVKDLDGEFRDLVVMELPVWSWLDWWGW